jgi:O-antigen ligase
VQSIRKPFNEVSLLFQLVLGCSIGVFSGAILWLIPPLVVFGILISAVLFYAAIKRPELALIGILIATSSIVFEEKLPQIFLGSFSFHLPDLVLLSQIGLIVFRWLVDPKFKLIRTPLDLPLLLFLGVTLVSTFIAISQSSVDVLEARRAIRVMSYYLTFFIVTNLARERRQIRSLINGLFALSTIVAGVMIVQFILGDSVRLMPGRIEGLLTQNDRFSDVTRILPPGWSIILVSFLAIFCILVLEKPGPLKWLKALQGVFLGSAFVFTFLRSYWAALIFVIILAAFIFRGINRQRIIRWGFAAVISVAFLMLFALVDTGSKLTGLISATGNRLGTVLSSSTYQGEDNSVTWRKIENEYAFSSFVKHPFIGLGMGGIYRPRDRRLDARVSDGPSYDFRKHIHNGHLWILIDTGLIGYLALMWLSLAFLIRGFKYWRKISNDRMKGVMIGFTLVYLAILIAALANSTFVQWRWTPVIGIIMGINEVLLRKYQLE